MYFSFTNYQCYGSLRRDVRFYRCSNHHQHSDAELINELSLLAGFECKASKIDFTENVKMIKKSLTVCLTRRFIQGNPDSEMKSTLA